MELLIVKLLSIVVILVVTIIGALIPFAIRSARKFPADQPHHHQSSMTEMLQHFSVNLAAGVFLGAAFLHLLPESLADLSANVELHVFGKDTVFPLGLTLCAAGLVFAEWLDAITNGFSNEVKIAAAPGADISDKSLVIVPRQVVRDCHSPDMTDEEILSESLLESELSEHEIIGNPIHHHHVELPKGKGAMPYVLAILLSFHSFVVGVALGATQKSADATVLFVAIVAHKWAEALAMSLSFEKHNIGFKRAFKVILLYTVMTPVGILIAIGMSEFLSGETGLVISAVITCFTGGVFVYTGVIHLLERDYCGKGALLVKILAETFGLVLMLVVSFWA